MATIDDLRTKVERLHGQLAEAQILYSAALIAEYPHKVGQVFVDKDGVHGQLTQIFVRDGNTVMATITLFRKDGSLGKRTMEMYSWRKWKSRNHMAGG